jgi:hypothetical protein
VQDNLNIGKEEWRCNQNKKQNKEQAEKRSKRQDKKQRKKGVEAAVKGEKIKQKIVSQHNILFEEHLFPHWLVREIQGLMI